MGSSEVSFLKYIAIGVIGIGLIVLCFVIFWDKDSEIVYTGAILIIISCIMSGLIIWFIGKSGLKYALIFGIGSYIVLIIYVVSAISEWEMKKVWISEVMILGLCTFVALIMGSSEVSFLKYIAIGLIGLIISILCYIQYFEKHHEVAYTGIAVIIISTILTGMIIGLNGKGGLKYVLVFGIGSYILLFIFLCSTLLAINEAEDIMKFFGFIILSICCLISIMMIESLNFFIRIIICIFVIVIEYSVYVSC